MYVIEGFVLVYVQSIINGYWQKISFCLEYLQALTVVPSCDKFWSYLPGHISGGKKQTLSFGMMGI